MFTVLLLSIGNFVLPVVSYIGGAVRLAQSNRWNKIQRALLLLMFPAMFIVPAVAFMSLKTNSSSTPPSKVECKPNSPATAVSTDFGPLTGSSHAGMVGDGWNYTIASPSAFGKQSKWGGNKLMLAVHESAGPTVTVTGHHIDFPKVELRFGSDPEPARERVLRVADAEKLDGKRDGGWYDFPNMVRAKQAGCYQLRFKSDRFDETLTLRIVSIGDNQ